MVMESYAREQKLGNVQVWSWLAWNRTLNSYHALLPLVPICCYCLKFSSSFLVPGTLSLPFGSRLGLRDHICLHHSSSTTISSISSVTLLILMITVHDSDLTCSVNIWQVSGKSIGQFLGWMIPRFLASLILWLSPSVCQCNILEYWLLSALSHFSIPIQR